MRDAHQARSSDSHATQALATRVSGTHTLVAMTEAGTSRSLRLLSEAGLLETRRQGRYVLYQLRPERLRLTEAVINFISDSSG
jgi:DNA-binding transcriptional ArsR family regulator